MKKIIIASIASLATLAMAPVAMSATSSNTASDQSSGSGGGDGIFGGGGAVVAAIKSLASEVQALAVAQEKSNNASKYQKDQNLSVAKTANSQISAVNALTQAQTAKNTEKLITNSLLQFPEKVVNPSQLSNQSLSQAIQNRKKLLTNLTTKTPASDTLYLDSADDSLAPAYGVGKPKKLHNNYFNFDSIMTPDAYNKKQQKAASAFLEYATKQYENLTTGVHFDKLKSKLNNMTPKKKAQALEGFINNPTYQKYQLAVRSAIAQKSVVLSNLNSLITERTPVKGLATKAGIPSNPNLPSGYASPLEVQNYIANERVNNPSWYKKMKTASPATVNREQLFILAEIESSLQRNHLTQERILATLSVLALQGSQSSKDAIGNAAGNVNDVIDKIDKNVSATSLSGS